MSKVNSEQAAFEEMIKGLDDAWQVYMNFNRPHRVEWNDAYFKSHYVNAVKYKTRPLLSEALLFGKSFLNWYTFDETPSNVEDVVIGLISSMKCHDGVFVINDEFFNHENSPALSPPGSAIQIKFKEWKSDCQGPRNQGASLTGTPRSSQKSPQSITKTKAQDWYDKLWGYLSSTPDSSNATYPKVAQDSINYLGYIAFQLLKVCVKDPKVVSLHIMMHTSQRVEKFFSPELGLTYTIPPHTDMLTRFKMNFDRFQPSGIRCLTMMVYSHITVTGENQDNLQAIFESGVLLALSLVGLGCLSWLHKASEATHFEPGDLLKYMGVRRHVATIRDIVRFARKVGQYTEEKSWKWCRLFADGAYAELSTQRDPMFAGTLMAVATKVGRKDPMWDIAQFKGRLNDTKKDWCYNWAQGIIQQSRAKTTESIRSAEGVRCEMESRGMKSVASLNLEIFNIPEDEKP